MQKVNKQTGTTQSANKNIPYHFKLKVTRLAIMPCSYTQEFLPETKITNYPINRVI